MADATTKKLAELITAADHAELRRAAIMVSSAVGSAHDGALVKALTGVMNEPNSELRMMAVDALGKLRVDSVLPALIELARQGGPEVESAARAAGQMGVRGARAMEKVMADANPALRRRIASALAFGGTESAAVAAAHALLDNDPGVVDAAARSLAAELPELTPGQRRALADHLIDSLRKRRKPPLPPASEAGMVRVLTAMHDPRAEAIYWACLDRRRPPNVRAAAIQAIGALPPPRTKSKLQELFDCALDPDFQIAAPTLLILKNLDIDRRNLKKWLALMDAPDLATRRFAVEKLGQVDAPEVARALVSQLSEPDRSFHEEVIATLGRLKSGRKLLPRALLEAESANDAWALARGQSTFAKELPSSVRTPLFAQACRYREKDDPRSDPLFFLLREMDADWTRKRVQERALALRKKRNYPAAHAYLRLLTRDPNCPDETRFELAAIGLKLSKHDLSPEARQSDPALVQFSRLLQTAFDTIRHVRQAKWLGEEELFYVGFHFAERNQRERQFGGEVLEMLIKRSPRSQIARNARKKLQSEGLP